MLHVSSTGCNEWQSFVKLSIAGLHRFYVTIVMHLRSYSSGGTTKFLTWTWTLNLQDFVQWAFNNVNAVMVDKLLDCSQVEQSIGIKSGLFDGKFSGSKNPGTWRRRNATCNCLSWMMSWCTIFIKDKVMFAAFQKACHRYMTLDSHVGINSFCEFVGVCILNIFSL